MNLIIMGGTGFIGRALVAECVRLGHCVRVLTRNPDKARNVLPQSVDLLQWPIMGHLTVDAVINLAGENISQRWTSSGKKRILESRLSTTKQLVHAIQSGQIQVNTVIHGSAVGYYGTSLNNEFTEENNGSLDSNDFLANVSHLWEQEAESVVPYGIRLIKARFGVVLGGEGGALPKMALPYRYFAGGPLGQGNQWVSWIHLKDVVGLMIYCLNEKQLEGAINFTSPNPCTMNRFGREIAKVLRRPHFVPAPAFVMRMLLGEMSDLLLKGQKVLPKKALQSDFSFSYPTIEIALRNLLLSRGE